MQNIPRSPPPALFTLRLWQEQLDAERSEWRGEIKNLATAETRYFRTWAEIAMLVPAMLDDASDEYSFATAGK